MVLHIINREPRSMLINSECRVYVLDHCIMVPSFAILNQKLAHQNNLRWFQFFRLSLFISLLSQFCKCFSLIGMGLCWLLLPYLLCSQTAFILVGRSQMILLRIFLNVVPLWSSANRWSEEIMVAVLKLSVMVLLITHLCQVVLMCAEYIQWQKL